MAASDELPRGWTVASPAFVAGQQPGITIPAAAGITHVLTDITTTILNTGANSLTPQISISTTSIGIITIGWLVVPAGVLARDSLDYPLSLPSAPGEVYNAFWDRVLAAGQFGSIIVKGYDI